MLKLFFKKQKITEEKAVQFFIAMMFENVDKSWEEIRDTLKIHDLKLKEDDVAKYDFVLALISLQMQAIENVFSKNQAERIAKLLMNQILSMPSLGSHAVEVIRRYDVAFKRSVEENKENPLLVIPALLLYRWVGEDIEKFSTKVAGQKIINPLLIAHLAGVLTHYKGYWMKVKNNYEVVAE
ncbi:MAG: hypothetical protein A2383_02445 [Candidatus Pacebacteria bacterium RIFOXYB1_FULL_39_46]|nr:MAG: hypothetical protein A2383_02445 [Candidatus Pacebacteria bacterium RIFOXYB1_FULL_39_46]